MRTVGLLVLIALAVNPLVADQEAGPSGQAAGDRDSAIAHWTPLAEKGNADAQYQLGMAYYGAPGEPPDYPQAATWLQKAAEQGHAEAQYKLATMYMTSKVGPKDVHKAAEWYLKSAELGNSEAQYSIGFLYSRGAGVPKDNLLSYMWLFLSAEQGNPRGISNLKGAEHKLTPDQIVQAKAMAEQWKASAQSPVDP